MREEISEKKTAITTVTKGIPFSKIEVRPEDQLPPTSFHPPSSPSKTSVALPTHPFSRQDVMATPSIAAGAFSSSRSMGNFNGLSTLPHIPNGHAGQLPSSSSFGSLTQQQVQQAQHQLMDQPVSRPVLPNGNALNS